MTNRVGRDAPERATACCRFYGDLFVPRESSSHVNRGIYRFLNNPVALLGQTWTYVPPCASVHARSVCVGPCAHTRAMCSYGVAVAIRSIDLGAVALVSHVAHIALTLIVEQAHKPATVAAH